MSNIRHCSLEEIMKWYTAREFFGMRGRLSYDGNNISKYAAELGDGWRAWVTIDVITFVALIISYLFGLSAAVIVFILALAIFVPLLMTAGFLMGAIARDFPPGEVLKIAFRHLRS